MEVHSGSGFDQAVGAETKPPSGKLSLFVARCSSCSVAGVVVSCKIPILATRVRFPGDATFFGRYSFYTIYVHFFFEHLQYQCPRGLMDKASVS